MQGCSRVYGFDCPKLQSGTFTVPPPEPATHQVLTVQFVLEIIFVLIVRMV